MELVEAPPEELQDALESGDTFWPWNKQEHISALISEEGSKTKSVEVPKKNVIQPNPIDLDTTTNAKTTYSPLPVYILPAANSKPTAPAPKAKSNPSLLVLQNIRKLVATVQASATTSKTQAAAYIAWHSG